MSDALLSIQILNEQTAQIKQLAASKGISSEHPDIKSYLQQLEGLKLVARQKLSQAQANISSKSNESQHQYNDHHHHHHHNHNDHRQLSSRDDKPKKVINYFFFIIFLKKKNLTIILFIN